MDIIKLPLALIALVVIVMTLVSGCIDSGEVEEKTYPLFDMELDTTANAVSITIISGELVWEDYEVTVNGNVFTTQTQTAGAGSTSIFTDPQGTSTIASGMAYTVVIKDIQDNVIISEMTETAV